MKNQFIRIAAHVFVIFILFRTDLSASPSQNEYNSAIDAFIEQQAYQEQGEEYRDARKILTHDLTHDGIAETVVLYAIEGPLGTMQHLAVFAKRDGDLIPIAHTQVGGKGIRVVDLRSIGKGAICLGTLDYNPEDPPCCPSVGGTTRYVLEGQVLREKKPGTTKRRRTP